MFGKKESTSEKIDTLIGKNTTIEGKISGHGTSRIDGTLLGDLDVKGDIIIGDEGRIQGNITCINVLISGTVEGNISTSEQLRITSSGKLFGDVEVKSFIVDEDAIFQGSCKMVTGENNNIDIGLIDDEAAISSTNDD